MSKRARRSLQLSLSGIEQANRALIAKSLTQSALAKQLQITRQTISKFFRGERIDRQYFIQLSESLELEWDEISESSCIEQRLEKVEQEQTFSQLESIIQRLQQQGQRSIQHRYGKIQVLDMSQPVALERIYIDVEVLETLAGRRRLEVADLVNVGVAESDINWRKLSEERIPGLKVVEKYPKLTIFGKPGSGKTTFLKYLALYFSSNTSNSSKLPIFISFRAFAAQEHQLNLKQYIQEAFFNCYKVNDPNLFETLLNNGKFLFLMDGLDEVNKLLSIKIIQETYEFSEKFYENQFIISCRIGAIDYKFENFVEVEIAEFDEPQIMAFVGKWFLQHELKQRKLIDELQANNSLQGLATNPLLLTLLCFIAEQSKDFPKSISELYKESLDIFLKTWDNQRGIERTQICQKLSIEHKEELLSEIAFFMAKQGRYFFKQKEIEQYIKKYLQNLLNKSNLYSDEQLNSETLLKSLEAEHGLLVKRAKDIYSFSHFAFHAYFTAKAIVSSRTPEELNQSLQFLATKSTDQNWQDVCLLTAEMLPSEDCFLGLMKQHIDGLIAKDRQLQ
ncbi:MAG TPA: NACHT domain-containing protein, partial [Coleofasciculaceae cyanobacterium]